LDDGRIRALEEAVRTAHIARDDALIAFDDH
jgi:hypothetical protein